jgi:effector-binding domain-containing protein
MIEIVTARSQPMLYITTQTSDRASSIASTIKLSLDQLSRFLDEKGTGPTGRPMAIFSDWTGRLVTIEVGYPVKEEARKFAAARIQAGRTPEGQAVRSVHRGPLTDYAQRHDDLLKDLRAAGLRTNGTTWEIYRNSPTGEDPVTELYALILDRGLSPAAT